MSKSELILEAFHRLKTDFTGIKGEKSPNTGIWLVTIFAVFLLVSTIVKAAMGTLVLKEAIENVVVMIIMVIAYVSTLYRHYKAAANEKGR